MSEMDRAARLKIADFAGVSSVSEHLIQFKLSDAGLEAVKIRYFALLR